MDEFAPVGIPAEVRNAVRLVAGRRPDERRYVLFAQGRTGSTLLGDLLASHPDVFFADEILRARVRSTRGWVEGQRRRRSAKIFGFHVKIYQLTDVQRVTDPGRWLRRMHERGWRVLALRRRNLLRHVLSNISIAATGTVHDRSGAEERVALTVDPDEVRYWIGIRAQVGRAEGLALEGVPHEPFIYEDDLLDDASWPETTRRAFTHLGVSPVPVATTLHRRNEGGLRTLVANYDELARSLSGTPYAQFLDD
jgi:hypothetical protein